MPKPGEMRLTTEKDNAVSASAGIPKPYIEQSGIKYELIEVRKASSATGYESIYWEQVTPARNRQINEQVAKDNVGWIMPSKEDMLKMTISNWDPNKGRRLKVFSDYVKKLSLPATKEEWEYYQNNLAPHN